jgi:hypothetical protein
LKRRPNPSPLLVVCASIALIGPAIAQPEHEAVWIEVASGGPEGDTILVTYPSPVGRRDVTRDFMELSKWGEWSYAPPEAQDAQDALRGAATYLGRARPGELVDVASGALPWPVFAQVFRRFATIRMAFSVEQPFYCKDGPGAYHNAYVELTLLKALDRNLFAVTVTTLEGAASSPSALAAGLEPVVPERQGFGSHLSPGARWAVLSVCGLLLGVAAFALTQIVRRGRRGR